MKHISEPISTTHAGRVRPGDHLCLPFASDAEQREVVSAFIADGLRRGERVLYFSDRTDPEALDAWLGPRGVDGALAIARGQLEVRTAADAWLGPRRVDGALAIGRAQLEVRDAADAWLGPRGGERHAGTSDGGDGAQSDDGHAFDPVEVVGGIRHAVRDARAAGFQGLRLTGEMSWALRGGGGAARAHEYESKVASTLVDSGDLAAVCQYDERLFERADLTGLVSVHQGVLRIDPLHDDRRLRIIPTYSPRGLRIAGVVDDATAAPLADALAQAAAWPGGEPVLVLDLAELTFIDVAGIRALVRFAESLAPECRVRVRHMPAAMRKVLRIARWSLEDADESL